VRAFISVGSNINPTENVREAVRQLSLHVHIIGISTVYLTEPVGRPGQPPYYNCVLEVETETPPIELKTQVLRTIEAQLGRERSVDKYAPRTIDLDLILYDDLMIETENLTLPDPDLVRRPFLAIPLCELAPELTLPGSNRRVLEVAGGMPPGSMEPLEGFTLALREEFVRGAGS
jgi:2-amino-4-hydroxy-6-hydroxymethyldihydropteridine diphosphokinase